MALIFDTGPLYASLDQADANHRACQNLIDTTNEPLLVPAPVLVEIEQLISRRLYIGIFLTLLDDINAGVYQIENPRSQDYARIRDICDRYADADIGFVDAAVLAIVERLNEPKLATLDHRHFGLLRPQHVDALELLPA